MCPHCGTSLRDDARFCGSCGTDTTAAAQQPAASTREHGARRPRPVWVALALLLLLAVAGQGEFFLERSSQQSATRDLRQQLTSAQHEIGSLSAQNGTLARRVGELGSSVQASKAGFAPLAKRLLKSVFTVQVSDGLGTGWAAWTTGGDTYVITANHVVADDVAAGIKTVMLKQNGKTWTATIGSTDPTNDLAVVIVHGRIAPPLWQQPQLGVSPVVGDQLLLLGSPYGLEGTVTTGVVSRVAYDAIQTDAAANPGNSGGPAIDRQGQVVGVLLSGGGENLNFAVPIQRACVTLRSC